MKNTKKILVFLLITFLGIFNLFTVIYAATEVPKEVLESTLSSSIVSLSNKTVNTETEFYLVLNLSNITYTKFRVDITNTNKLTVDKVTENVLSLSSNTIATSFIVDKNSINLEKLGVVYTSPSEETVINFSVKITNLDETRDEISAEISNVELEINGLKDTLNSLNEILKGIEDTTSDLYISTENSIKEATNAITTKEQEKTKLEEKLENFSSEVSEDASINVIYNNLEMEEKENPWGDKDSMLDKNMEKEMNASMKKMMEQMNSLEMDLENANNKISSLTKGETYKGSANNYLKSLSITGIEFKNEFNKTTADYFARLENDHQTSVIVNATAEDTTAIVTIYGNTDLKDGKNKIIINVTADNGDVRTYRIYLTK